MNGKAKFPADIAVHLRAKFIPNIDSTNFDWANKQREMPVSVEVRLSDTLI